MQKDTDKKYAINHQKYLYNYQHSRAPNIKNIPSAG